MLQGIGIVEFFALREVEIKFSLRKNEASFPFVVVPDQSISFCCLLEINYSALIRAQLDFSNAEMSNSLGTFSMSVKIFNDTDEQLEEGCDDHIES